MPPVFRGLAVTATLKSPRLPSSNSFCLALLSNSLIQRPRIVLSGCDILYLAKGKVVCFTVFESTSLASYSVLSLIHNIIIPDLPSSQWSFQYEFGQPKLLNRLSCIIRILMGQPVLSPQIIGSMTKQANATNFLSTCLISYMLMASDGL